MGGFLCGAFLGCLLIPAKAKRFINNEEETSVIIIQNCTFKNSFFRIIGMIGFIVLAGGSFFMFYQNLDIYDYCPWCKNLTCVIDIANLCNSQRPI